MNKKILGTAIGAGVTYLMRNKSARDKLISTVRNFVSDKENRSNTGKSTPSQHPADSYRSGDYTR
ncbi:hypothetical protein SAMN05444162_4543 [Paenibacillaceae bacterium GAS479]|nr:hypothetical protein SAMN05444162_4543 [Paenibacillaceae bacterium GAS479]